MEIIYYSWNDIGKMMKNLLAKIRKFVNLNNVDGIYGIPRGGLPTAVFLSHHLDKPLLLYPTHKSIVCDDISDTGNTAKNIKSGWFVTLFSTNWTETKPDLYVEKKKKGTWVVYPWERKNDIT